MKSGNWAKTVLVLLLGALCFALAVSTNAQIQTEKSTTVGRTTMQVQVERGEVVLVNGNDLVVKMEDGTIRHFPNLPERPRKQEPHPRFLKVGLCLGGVQSGMKLGGRIEGKSVGADHAFD